MKKYLLIFLSALLCFAAGCTGSDTTSGNSASEPEHEPETDSEPAPDSEQEAAPAPAPEPVPDVITGSIKMEDGGVITFELYPDIAPQSVRNFVYLARQGFYDGLKFHRIISGFMIQGGCPLGEGTGNPGYSIFGEFEQNGHANNLSHDRGVMSMARSQDFNSAGSQFFICHGDPHFLDGGYAAFGMVTSGMDIVDEIAETPVLDNNGRVARDNMPAMKTIKIDGNFELPEPDKIAR